MAIALTMPLSVPVENMGFSECLPPNDSAIETEPSMFQKTMQSAFFVASLAVPVEKFWKREISKV